MNHDEIPVNDLGIYNKIMNDFNVISILLILIRTIGDALNQRLR